MYQAAGRRSAYHGFVASELEGVPVKWAVIRERYSAEFWACQASGPIVTAVSEPLSYQPKEKQNAKIIGVHPLGTLHDRQCRQPRTPPCANPR